MYRHFQSEEHATAVLGSNAAPVFGTRRTREEHAGTVTVPLSPLLRTILYAFIIVSLCFAVLVGSQVTCSNNSSLWARDLSAVEDTDGRGSKTDGEVSKEGRELDADISVGSSADCGTDTNIQGPVKGSQKCTDYPATIVTGYFKLPKSKHSDDEYAVWIESFLSKVANPLIIFTTPELEPTLLAFRGVYANMTRFETNYDVWTFPVTAAFAQEYQTIQRALNQGEVGNVPELYAIWAAKAYMVRLATEQNPFASKYFLWVDIGAFRERDHPFQHWPDVNRLEQTWQGREDMMLFGLIRRPVISGARFWLDANSETPPTRHFPLIEGTFFAGTIPAIQWYEREFYNYRDKWIRRGVYVGDEQHLMTTIAALNWRHVMVLDLEGLNCSAIDSWFYFTHWFAVEEEGLPRCGWINVTLISDADSQS